MTVSTTTSRADYTGNGVATAFTVPFYFLDSAHLTVLRTDTTTGVSTTLTLTTDYSVTGAGNPAGGTVTLTVAPTSLQKISILRNVPFTQLTDYVENDPFPAASHEMALDKLTMVVQQINEAISRALTLPASTTGVSTLLPTAQPLYLLGFNSAGNAITSYNPEALLTVAGSSGFAIQQFSGTGAKTSFTLSDAPGAVSNLEVFISGVRQQPTADYTVSGQTLTFVSAPALGTNNIFVRWGQTLGIGVPSDSSVTTGSIVDGAVTTAKLADASVTTAKLASVIAPVVSSLNGGQLAGFRNKIINGKMDISQRGTSFGTASLDGSYTLDRWIVGNSSAATFTVSQQLGVGNLQNCARVVVGTPDASIAAGDQAIFQQSIEGFNAFDLIGTTFTISFWVRSSVTGAYCIALRNSAFDRSYIATYTVNAVDTWEYKTVTVAGGLPASGGTWNFTNGAGLRVAWTLACASTFQTTAGAWQTGNFVGTSAQANFLATGGNTFQLTGVQLEVGSVATPFEHRPYGAELALCQRYGRPVFSGSSGRAGSATVLDLSVVLSSDMRVAPTLAFGGFSGANTTVAQLGVGNVTVTGISASISTPRSVYAAFNTTGATTGSALAVTAGDLAFASAEL